MGTEALKLILHSLSPNRQEANLLSRTIFPQASLGTYQGSALGRLLSHLANLLFEL